MMILASAAESGITSHQRSQGPTEMRQPLNVDSICLSGDESAALALAEEGITDRGPRYLTLLLALKGNSPSPYATYTERAGDPLNPDPLALVEHHLISPVVVERKKGVLS